MGWSWQAGLGVVFVAGVLRRPGLDLQTRFIVLVGQLTVTRSHAQGEGACPHRIVSRKNSTMGARGFTARTQRRGPGMAERGYKMGVRKKSIWTYFYLSILMVIEALLWSWPARIET